MEGEKQISGIWRSVDATGVLKADLTDIRRKRGWVRDDNAGGITRGGAPHMGAPRGPH